MADDSINGVDEYEENYVQDYEDSSVQARLKNTSQWSVEARKISGNKVEVSSDACFTYSDTKYTLTVKGYNSNGKLVFSDTKSGTGNFIYCKNTNTLSSDTYIFKFTLVATRGTSVDTITNSEKVTI
jgi:hypothetical protein